MANIDLKVKGKKELYTISCSVEENVPKIFQLK